MDTSPQQNGLNDIEEKIREAFGDRADVDKLVADVIGYLKRATAKPRTDWDWV